MICDGSGHFTEVSKGRIDVAAFYEQSFNHNTGLMVNYCDTIRVEKAGVNSNML